MVKEVSRYKCQVCGEIIIDKTAAEEHELKCLAKRKEEEDYFNSIHRIENVYLITRFTLKCRKCGESFIQDVESDCTAPCLLSEEEKYTCTHCGEKATINEKEAEESFHWGMM